MLRIFYVCLFQPDLLGVFFQQFPLQERGLDAHPVAVGLVALADDGNQVALLGVVHGVMQCIQPVGQYARKCGVQTAPCGGSASQRDALNFR